MSECRVDKFSSRVCEKGKKSCVVLHGIAEGNPPENVTYDDKGNALVLSRDGLSYPAELTFECVNDFVHRVDVEFEELQCLCLGLIGEIEKMRKALNT